MRFFTCNNNGVTAIVSEDVYNDITKHEEIYREFTKREEETEYKDRWRAVTASKATSHLMKPIFTFVREERLNESPWFTGGSELLGALIMRLDTNGDYMENGSFYVPFSNGCEIGLHGKNSMESELAYVTTRQQFFETFGVRIEDLTP